MASGPGIGRFEARNRKAVAALQASAIALALAACPGSARSGEGYALTGVGGGPDSFYAYQGVLYAPSGSLSDSGPQLRAWAKGYQFTYEADLPSGPDREIEAFGTSLEAEAGWQFASQAVRFGLFAGAAWRDHQLTPDDPGSDLQDARVGFSGTLDAELRLPDGFGSFVYANYLTGFDQYWVQVRPYMTAPGGWKFGPEAVWSGGEDYEHGRVGLFFNGVELTLGAFGRIFVGGEAGARFDLRDDNVDPYAGLNAGFLF